MIFIICRCLVQQIQQYTTAASCSWDGDLCMVGTFHDGLDHPGDTRDSHVSSCMYKRETLQNVSTHTNRELLLGHMSRLSDRRTLHALAGTPGSPRQVRSFPDTRVR